MAANLSDPIVKAITTARVKMLFNMPFFGNIATRLELVETQWCKSFAVDGRHFFYNREYIKDMTPDQLVFVFGHCVMHCALDHIGRRGGRDKAVWDMATDYVVNYTLKKMKIGDAPKGSIYDENFTDEMSAEEVYRILEEQKNKGKGPGAQAGGYSFDQHLEFDGSDGDDGDAGGEKGELIAAGGGKDPNGNPDPGDLTGVDYSKLAPQYTDDQLQSIRNDVRVAIISSSQVNTGNVPAAIERMIHEFTNPTINWRELLTNSIQSSIKDDYSFNKPSRRSWDVNGDTIASTIMPGSKNMETIDVVVSLDTSGSIGDKKFAAFLAEVKSILEQYQDYKLHIWCIDAAIYNHQTFTPNNADEIDSYKAFGGGGNDFPLNWSYMRENDILPELFVVFSDGYPCGSWGDPEYCDTIFVIANEWDKTIVAPFGRTAYMDDVDER